jgi:hypothetical protein
MLMATETMTKPSPWDLYKKKPEVVVLSHVLALLF